MTTMEAHIFVTKFCTSWFTGIVTDVLQNSIVVDIPNNVVRPLLTSFILFSKTNAANQGSLKGYYLEATFANDSTKKAELFSVGADVFESSK
jgi:hypothetical protein